MVQRLLSDPTIFPREFKNWITEHSSDTVDISKSQVHGLVSSTGQIILTGASMGALGQALVGVILPYAKSTPPGGWLPCDGQAYSTIVYSNLFGVLGYTFGGSGNQFNVPDLRGRTVYGFDSNLGFNSDEGQPAGGRGPSHHHQGGAHQHVGGSHAHPGNAHAHNIAPHSHYMDHRHDVSVDASIQHYTFTSPGSTGAGSQEAQSYSTSYASMTDTYSNTAGLTTDTQGGGNTGPGGQVNTDFGGVVDTSGGGTQDKPGHKALNWIIGSGNAPP
jgi:microcystin-dependent protein